MSPNIFKISASELGLEDRFTASLGYLIDNIPEIGQGFFDLLAEGAGLPPTSFIAAVDHPPGDAENRPDFLLRGTDYDILCEHKLDSNLGERQLQRYMALPFPNRTYVALITNNSLSVPLEVLCQDRYLRPKNSAIPYFTWDALYPIVAAHGSRLAKEFTAFMRQLDMAPPCLPATWEHLFVDRDTANAFFSLTSELRAFFKGKGARVQRDPSSLGFQVRYPKDWIHLLYFCVERSAAPEFSLDGGPYLAARLWIERSESVRIRNSPILTGNMLVEGRRIHGRSAPEVVAKWDRTLVLGYEFVTELAPFLTEEIPLSRQRFLDYGMNLFANFDRL